MHPHFLSKMLFSLINLSSGSNSQLRHILNALVINGFIALILSGCSSLTSQLASPSQQVTEEPLKPLTSLTGKEKISPRLIWQKKLYSQPRGYIEIYPQISGNKIIAAGLDSVSAFNKASGSLVWKETLGQTITGGLNTDGKHIFVGTENGSAIALDSKTGKTQWITLLKQPIVAISTAKDEKVVFRTLTGKIHVLSTKNGEMLWQHTQRTPALSLQGSSTPLLAGPYVITGFDTGAVTAYELATGNEAWSVKLGVESGLTELSKLIDIDAEMKTIGTALFAVSYQGSIAGIDMRTGKVGWRRKISSFSGIDANEKALFVTDNPGQVWMLNPLTGEPIWKNDDLLRRIPTAPAIIGNSLVIVGDSEGYLHWYNTKTGKIIGREKGDTSGYAVAPIVQGKIIYAFGKSGLLSVYSTQY